MGWVTENVLWQKPGEGLGTIVRSLSGHGARRPEPSGLVHLLNPYPPANPAAALVQKRTLESIARARKTTGGIHLVAVVAPDDAAAATGFDAIVRMPGASSPPPVFDILAKGSHAGVPGSHIVFTNMDICLSPGFYGAVRELLTQGAGALIINRRTVHDWEIDSETAALARFDLGANHPGLDCFIFPRKWVAGFVTSPAVVGHGHVMRGLLYNLVARAAPLVVLTEVAMTYHYGDDRPWRAQSAQSQFAQNRKAAVDVYSELAQDPTYRHRLDAFVAALPKYLPKP